MPPMSLHNSRITTIADLRAHHRQRNRQFFTIILAIISAIATTSAYFYRLLHQHCGCKSYLMEYPELIKYNLDVSQPSFIYIADLLQSNTRVCNSQNNNTDEQLGIFLFAVATNVSLQQIGERFQNSILQIYHIYHRVMGFLIDSAIYNSVIHPASAGIPLSDHNACNRNFYSI